MKLEWLGNYRGFFENLFRYTNTYGQIYNVHGFHQTSVPCSLAQIQVLEHILENEEKHQNMSEIAQRLGISASAFSKNVKKMMDKGLLEKYHSSINKKDVIVKASETGRQVYREYADNLYQFRFKRTFEMLDHIPLEYVEQFAEILGYNADSIQQQMSQSRQPKEDLEAPPVELIRIE